MTEPWWKGAAVYQIYPRSFADANGDGVGDLRGITAHLDHVASLGVDAIWISPFYTSPMRDFGYDVADYCDVDPTFGTLADFDALVARAHDLGLKVITDQVWSHTSDQHAWFRQSRQRRDGDKHDWYVWADAKADGAPPNNWQSVFGGPAWTWDARRQQYYLHTFLREQPQLNVRNAAVQEALLAVGRFWLERGVDGFRLDAINHAMGSAALTDNPPAPPSNKPRTRSFDFQIKQHSQDQPDMLPFVERIRALTDEYADRFTVAEIGGEESDWVRKDYTAPRRLDTAYGFDFLYADQLTPALVRAALAQWPGAADEGWPSWAFENHDAPRAVSRWALPEHRDAFARAKMVLLAGLRGNIFLYQGEELGLTQVAVPFELLQDPEAIANWPLTLSRDGARTPMPWHAGRPGHGFTAGTPWLPFGADHGAMAVDAQEADTGSLLHWTRRLLALRRAHAALRVGTIAFVDLAPGVVAFERVAGDERLLCAVNLTPEPRELALPDGVTLVASGVSGARFEGYGAMLALCTPAKAGGQLEEVGASRVPPAPGPRPSPGHAGGERRVTSPIGAPAEAGAQPGDASASHVRSATGARRSSGWTGEGERSSQLAEADLDTPAASIAGATPTTTPRATPRA
ncbi:alpha-glucosidase family protein [Sphingomonas sp. RHCKR7]|uniref:alpha-glucosidase family protein n=1 Tax=Sphingomonas folli TaxID=2862497 RepID=UPI001C680C69|nr:alpha-glucosidase family protein [Sphingomonas folli]